MEEPSSWRAEKRKLRPWVRRGPISKTHVVKKRDPRKTYMDIIEDAVIRSNKALSVATQIVRCWLIHRISNGFDIPKLSKCLIVLFFAFNFNPQSNTINK